jgi:hypothetical protein
LFQIAIQAAIGGRIIAREMVKAKQQGRLGQMLWRRRDRKELLDKQKRKASGCASLGKVTEIPQLPLRSPPSGWRESCGSPGRSKRDDGGGLKQMPPRRTEAAGPASELTGAAARAAARTPPGAKSIGPLREAPR